MILAMIESYLGANLTSKFYYYILQQLQNGKFDAISPARLNIRINDKDLAQQLACPNRALQPLRLDHQIRHKLRLLVTRVFRPHVVAPRRFVPGIPRPVDLGAGVLTVAGAR